MLVHWAPHPLQLLKWRLASRRKIEEREAWAWKKLKLSSNKALLKTEITPETAVQEKLFKITHHVQGLTHIKCLKQRFLDPLWKWTPPSNSIINRKKKTNLTDFNPSLFFKKKKHELNLGYALRPRRSQCHNVLGPHLNKIRFTSYCTPLKTQSSSTANTSMSMPCQKPGRFPLFSYVSDQL